jgi:hypothetical protein
VAATSRHLRHLDDHPQAARFFAAVLGKRTGAARGMLPLLHEPVRRALDTLGVGVRKRYWRHAGKAVTLRDTSQSYFAVQTALFAILCSHILLYKP